MGGKHNDLTISDVPSPNKLRVRGRRIAVMSSAVRFVIALFYRHPMPAGIIAAPSFLVVLLDTGYRYVQARYCNFSVLGCSSSDRRFQDAIHWYPSNSIL